MVRNFELTDPNEPNNAAYAQTLDYLHVNPGMLDLNSVMVAAEIGCLVVPDASYEKPSELIVFSNTLHNDVIKPPAEIEALDDKTFNQNSTAKGLGTHVANTPEATEMKGSLPDRISVYSVPLFGEQPIVKRAGTDKDNLFVRGTRLVKHLGLFVSAELTDRRGGGHAGLQRSIDFMERHDGDEAQVAVFPTPPSWRMSQEAHGIDHLIIPRGILVKGGDSRTQLRRIGTFPTRSLNKIQSV